MAIVKLLLAGDVMTGRGIDQILPHPSPPGLYEDFVRSAEGYVALAEARNGAIERPVPLPYIWGDALREVKRHAPDLRIVNLETARSIIVLASEAEDADAQNIKIVLALVHGPERRAARFRISAEFRTAKCAEIARDIGNGEG